MGSLRSRLRRWQDRRLAGRILSDFERKNVFDQSLARNLRELARRDPELAKSVALDLAKKGAHTSLGFWETLVNLAYEARSPDSSSFGESISTLPGEVLRENPHVIHDLLDRGLQQYKWYWDLVREGIPHLPKSDVARVLLKGFSLGAHSNPGYWLTLRDFVARYPNALDKDDLKTLVFEGYRRGAHTLWEFWRGLSGIATVDPGLGMDIIYGLRSLGAQRHKEFSELVEKYMRRYPEYVDPSLRVETTKRLVPELFGGISSGRNPWESVAGKILQYPGIHETVLPYILDAFEHGKNSSDYWRSQGYLLENHPEFARDLAPIIKRGFEEGAYRHPDFLRLLLTINSINASDLFQDHPVGSLLRLISHVNAGKKLDKTTIRSAVPKEFREHPALAALYQLGVARGYYLSQLLRDPRLAAQYLDLATHAIKAHGLSKLGRRYFKWLYEELPLFRLAREHGIDPRRHISRTTSKKKIGESLRQEVVNRLLAGNEALGTLITPEHISKRFPHTVSTLLYARAHPDPVLDLLQNYSNPEDLFKLKFGHYGLHKELLKAAKTINEKKIPVHFSTLDHLLQALREEAEHERLYEKRAENEDEKVFLETARRIYDRILKEKGSAQITPEELRILRNTKLARKVGISETVSKILSFFEAKKNAKGVLRVALDPLDHLHLMNVPGSCQSPGREHSEGAIATTGGPALVVGALDEKGTVLGRVALYGYEDPRGRLIFVPNYSYGAVDLTKAALDVLKKHGVPVHDSVNPPLGYRPAKSQHYYKSFWKDGKRGLEEFR